MSKLTDSFKAVGVFNPHAFYGDEPYIYYQPDGPSRSMTYSAWVVRKYNESLSEHWRDYGAKHFDVRSAGGGSHRDRKVAALVVAQDWASERFGVATWEKDPYGGYGRAEFVRERVAALKAAVERAAR